MGASMAIKLLNGTMVDGFKIAVGIREKQPGVREKQSEEDATEAIQEDATDAKPSWTNDAMKSIPSCNDSEKCHAKIRVGIEDDDEFRVARRAISLSRNIWQADEVFQQHGGKIRLRGRGAGGENECDQPLILYITCLNDKELLDRIVQHVEHGLGKVHADYKIFCQEHDMPMPELKVIKEEWTRKVTMKSQHTPNPQKLVEQKTQAKGERHELAPPEEDIYLLIEERND